MKKTPTAQGGEGVDNRAGVHPLNTADHYQTQYLIARHALAPATAAIVAALAWEQMHHG